MNAEDIVRALADSDALRQEWCGVCGKGHATEDPATHESGCAFVDALQWVRENGS